MLEPLLINGIIKLTPSEDEDCGYKIEEGPYKEKFRRVVFLGDYVDRGDFSVENIKNIVKLDKLFNSQNNTKSETDNNGDFMKFLCGNHDTLYFFYNMDGYSDSKQQSYELRELLFSEKEEDKKLIQDFYSALSVAHMEELDCKKELYYTHSYCTKKMQEAIKKQKGQYITIYGDEIHLLNRGTVYELDKQYQLHPEKIFNNTFKEIL